MLRTLLAIALFSFPCLLQADTLEIDLTKFDPQVLELNGIAPEAFTPQGLLIKTSEIGKELSLLSKAVYSGRLVITLDYEIRNGPGYTSLALRLDNPEKKRRLDLGDYIGGARRPKARSR
jgi:hypothetical protein